MIKIDLDNDKQVDYICDYFKNEALENQIEEKDKEIKKLNNIINNAREYMAENIAWRYQNEVIDELIEILQGDDKE